MRVVKLIIELGLYVKEDGGIYCGSIQIPPTKVARACNVDRRVVNTTIQQIIDSTEIRDIFFNIRPAGPFFRNIAKHFGFGVVEVIADPKTTGIIAKATSLIAEEGISIRQILADDPELYPNPKLTIITERAIPGKLIPELLKIKGVMKISIY